MTIGDAVKARLLDMSPLTDLIEQRVYELFLPQNEKRSAVRFQIIGAPHETHIRGPVNHYAHRCQVDIYIPETGATDAIVAARQVGAAVLGDQLGRDATGLGGWYGVVSGNPSIHIFDVDVLGDGDLSREDDEQLRIRNRQEYRVYWRYLTVEPDSPGSPGVDDLGVLTFTASADHADVTSYTVNIYELGGPLAASMGIGKPEPNDDGDISVDLTGLLTPLPDGNYTVTVVATSPGGDTESDGADFSLPL